MKRKSRKPTPRTAPRQEADQSQPTKGGPPLVTSPLVEVRDSPVHGRGVFAAAPIARGTRILEYLGERMSHKAADARYADHDETDNHTFLFIVDKHTVIDAAVGGNDARFINHQCAGNCESVIENRRVFIDAARDIAAGDELGYDYEIGREKDDPPNVDEIYACRCGSPQCRGTMLWPPKKTSPKKSVPKKSVKQERRKSAARNKRKPQAQRPQAQRSKGRRGERLRRRA